MHLNLQLKKGIEAGKRPSERRVETLGNEEKYEKQIAERVASQLEGKDGAGQEPIKIEVTEKDFLPLKKLGRGSFGDVYLVRKVGDKSEKLYAMKTLSKRREDDYNWMRYVMTERNVLAGNKNPFLAKLNYAFQTKKYLFLILDFCPGGDLDRLLAHQTQIPEDTAKLYAAEIVIALADLHARDIIYRDLKPDNVVID